MRAHMNTHAEHSTRAASHLNVFVCWRARLLPTLYVPRLQLAFATQGMQRMEQQLTAVERSEATQIPHRISPHPAPASLLARCPVCARVSAHAHVN